MVATAAAAILAAAVVVADALGLQQELEQLAQAVQVALATSSSSQCKEK
jgi:hypothetical protein